MGSLSGILSLRHASQEKHAGGESGDLPERRFCGPNRLVYTNLQNIVPSKGQFDNMYFGHISYKNDIKWLIIH